jgi:uncharacterized protein YbbK (DUF523 family)
MIQKKQLRHSWKNAIPSSWGASRLRVVRQLITACAVLGVGLLMPQSAARVSGATTTTSTTTTVPADSTAFTTTTSTTTTSTTTTTLPSAVTTLPEGCPSAPAAQAVFVGKVQSIKSIEVIFAVVQLRTGSIDNYITNNVVPVIYGTDAKFLSVGESYLVGVTTDPTSSRLVSAVSESVENFGGAEIAGANSARCPQFENPARTLHVDGTAIDAGMFTQLADSQSRLVFALVAPPILVIAGLVILRRYRRQRR